MNDPFNTQNLQDLAKGIRAGDVGAANDLVRVTLGRLQPLASKQLGRFARIRRWEDTDSVLQGALLRLLRTLEKIEPTSTRHFLSLAARQLRLELIDLSRHYFGPLGMGTHHDSVAPRDGDESPALDPADKAAADRTLERWAAFHEAVEQLPAAEREVVSLVFYHDWTQARIAELFQVDERTVRRYWQKAVLRLQEKLGDELPDF
jgi:RNA polymerase sigma-70 factor (ECF subfamily)